MPEGGGRPVLRLRGLRLVAEGGGGGAGHDGGGAGHESRSSAHGRYAAVIAAADGSSVIGAHFCAAIPNFAVMEIDIDSVPWRDELVTVSPRFEDGSYVVPDAPGWGLPFP